MFFNMISPVTSEFIASEISLYELALACEPSSSTLTVSPSTFKSLVASLIDLLIGQNIPAVIWAKLPRGEAWQAELARYCQVAHLPQAIYSFSQPREDLTEAEEGPPHRDGGADLADLPDLTWPVEIAPNPANYVPPLFAIQLAAENSLKREYFLLIASPQFSGVLVIQRARSPHAKLEASAAIDTLTGVPDISPEEAQKKTTLLTLLSFNQATVSPILNQIKQILLTETQTILGRQEPGVISPEQLLAHDQHPVASQPSLTPPILSQFLVNQIQRHEDLWQKSNGYRRRAELVNLLQMQNEELLNTLRLKDEFLNNVGQELRTPLTNMKTALTLLTSPSLKLPQKQRYMELLIKECDRQGSLITSLLELVRIDQMAEATTVQALRLSEVVPGVVSTYQPLAEEKGIRLAYTVPPDLPMISCLNTWLKQIVINLLHNGIKFTPRGGQVWVRAKQQGDYVQLEFRDTGIGIASGEIPKIFDRFYRVRQMPGEETAGAGLGLTIVQQLLLYCGGSISVKSRLGEGSVFNVLLPIYRSPSEEEVE
jgi:two-component system, OmpR family, phosphate regulon sensor histidine kinase PhoR